MVKDLVVEDKEDVVKDSGSEKNICNSESSGTEEVTTAKINVGTQTNIMILSREFQNLKAEVQQEIAKFSFLLVKIC